MSTQMVNLYDALSETFGKDRAHLAIKDIEDYLNDHKRELATKEDVYAVRGDIRETELKLTKEIEQVRLDLTLKIEHVRGDLTREIESVRLEVEKVRSSLIKWMISLFVTGFGLIIAVITLLK